MGMIIEEPPGYYMKYNGKLSKTKSLVGDWSYPEYEYSGMKDWIAMGHCPTPRTRWQHLRYDIGHGLAMQYGLFSVLVFAFRNNKKGGWPSRLRRNRCRVGSWEYFSLCD